MKILFLLFTLLSLNNCAQEIPEEISYTAVTRGSYLEIEVKDHSLKVFKTNAKTLTIDRKLTEAETKSLYKIVSKLSITEIPKLAPPSKDHQFDGALIGNLTVRIHNTRYASQSFDHGNPPQEIKTLVDSLLKIAGK